MLALSHSLILIFSLLLLLPSLTLLSSFYVLFMLPYYFMLIMSKFMSSTDDRYLHVVFEDICSSGHVYNVVNDEFTESSKQVSPLVESLDLVGLILLVSLYEWKSRENVERKGAFC